MNTKQIPTADSEIKPRVVILSDGALPCVADLHVRALPDDILPALGREIVFEYYRDLIYSGRTMLLGAYLTERLVGFVCLSFSPVKLNSIFKNKCVSVAKKLISLAIFRPLLVIDGIISFVRTGTQPESECEIVYIAVDPAFHKRGIGKVLAGAVVDLMSEHQLRLCRTKTLANNSHVLRMYQHIFHRVDICGGYKAVRREYIFLRMSLK